MPALLPRHPLVFETDEDLAFIGEQLELCAVAQHIRPHTLNCHLLLGAIWRRVPAQVNMRKAALACVHRMPQYAKCNQPAGQLVEPLAAAQYMQRWHALLWGRPAVPFAHRL